MKRIIILLVLVILAGIAGVVVRSTRGGTVAEIRELVSHESAGDVRDEINQTHELSPGAKVELIGLNGAVKIATSNSNKAEIHIERIASSQESLDRRKITIEADANRLRIKGEKSDNGLFSKLFGSSASERVTLKLPRQISLLAKGVNGAVTSGEIEGPLEISGINGKVQIAGATGRAELSGINGSVVVGLTKLGQDGVRLSGINGNIELQLGADVNADFAARGMNGRVTSDLQNVAIDRERRGSYTARIGSGGSEISASGINGNIRFTR